jgi:hypothetical protein
MCDVISLSMDAATKGIIDRLEDQIKAGLQKIMDKNGSDAESGSVRVMLHENSEMSSLEQAYLKQAGYKSWSSDWNKKEWSIDLLKSPSTVHCDVLKNHFRAIRESVGAHALTFFSDTSNLIGVVEFERGYSVIFKRFCEKNTKEACFLDRILSSHWENAILRDGGYLLVDLRKPINSDVNRDRILQTMCNYALDAEKWPVQLRAKDIAQIAVQIEEAKFRHQPVSRMPMFKNVSTVAKVLLNKYGYIQYGRVVQLEMPPLFPMVGRVVRPLFQVAEKTDGEMRAMRQKSHAYVVTECMKQRRSELVRLFFASQHQLITHPDNSISVLYTHDGSITLDVVLELDLESYIAKSYSAPTNNKAMAGVKPTLRVEARRCELFYKHP